MTSRPIGTAVLLLSVTAGSAARGDDEPAVSVRQVMFLPCEAEADVPGSFRLAERSFECREQTVAAELVRVTFPSPVASGHAPNDLVRAELHLPAGGAAAPGVVFLHYLDGDRVLPRLFCRTLALRGTAALLVSMPYYHERREGTDRRMVSPDVALTAAAVRQAALDVRYARAYLASRPDVDRDRIGVAGLSLGGIVGSLAFEIEPRLDRGCFMLAGADVPNLLWESELTAKHRRGWEAAGVTKADLAAAFAAVDPASYPGRRAGRPVLLLNARDDAVMPAAGAAALAAALTDPGPAGGPEVVWYGGGHAPRPADVADALVRFAEFFAPDADRP